MLLLHRMFIWPQRFLHYVNCQQALATLKKIILTTKDAKKLRMLLQSFIDKIVINDEEIVIHYLPERIIQNHTVHRMEDWHAHGDSNPGCRRERAVS